VTARAKADDDAPSSASSPSDEAPFPFDGDVRIPAPPILPTPASMGMDALGVPSRSAGDLGAAVSAVRRGRGARSTGANIWVGVGVGVVLSLGVVVLYLLRG